MLKGLYIPDEKLSHKLWFQSYCGDVNITKKYFEKEVKTETRMEFTFEIEKGLFFENEELMTPNLIRHGNNPCHTQHHKVPCQRRRERQLDLRRRKGKVCESDGVNCELVSLLILITEWP